MERVEQLYDLVVINNVIRLTGFQVIVMVTHSGAVNEFYPSNLSSVISLFFFFIYEFFMELHL